MGGCPPSLLGGQPTRGTSRPFVPRPLEIEIGLGGTLPQSPLCPSPFYKGILLLSFGGPAFCFQTPTCVAPTPQAPDKTPQGLARV